MGRISFDIERCQRCRMHLSLCVCSLIPTCHVQTQIILVMHVREFQKISSTGPLALECLPNSTLLIHGHRENQLDLTQYVDDNRRLLFLFPREGAPVLDSAFVAADDRPVTLVVPDGNWAQAARMGRRLPGVQHFTNVTLPPGQRTQWGLRKESHKDGLATFEAISKSLGILESPDVQQKMDGLFQTMVERTHKLRGTTPL